MSTELTAEWIRSRLPIRPADGHKGTFGHVLVIAGSRGFTGAAKLCAEGAARSGVGLVTAAVPQSLAPLIVPGLLEMMWVSLPATKSDALGPEALAPALAAAERKDAVVLGPGLSSHEDTRKFVLEFVKQCRAPMVLDADALNAAGIHPGVIGAAESPVVVTPHPGEMARLAGVPTEQVQREREKVAEQFAVRYRCVVVLKGYRTVIAGPAGEILVNPTGNNGMATGGTGDVLAGLIGGLIAQGMPPHDAAAVGVYVHGLAGDLAAGELTPRGMVARDVLAAIPGAWKQIEGG